MHPHLLFSNTTKLHLTAFEKYKYRKKKNIWNLKTETSFFKKKTNLLSVLVFLSVLGSTDCLYANVYIDVEKNLF
jgi:hypothetical protein